jgi:hypothetical protein
MYLLLICELGTQTLWNDTIPFGYPKARITDMIVHDDTVVVYGIGFNNAVEYKQRLIIAPISLYAISQRLFADQTVFSDYQKYIGINNTDKPLSDDRIQVHIEAGTQAVYGWDLVVKSGRICYPLGLSPPTATSQYSSNNSWCWPPFNIALKSTPISLINWVYFSSTVPEVSPIK